MKATINGITIEGTPEEVWTLLQRQEGTSLKPVYPMPDFHGPWWGVAPDTLVPRITGAATNAHNITSDTRVIAWNGQPEPKAWDGIWRN